MKKRTCLSTISMLKAQVMCFFHFFALLQNLYGTKKNLVVNLRNVGPMRSEIRKKKQNKTRKKALRIYQLFVTSRCYFKILRRSMVLENVKQTFFSILCDREFNEFVAPTWQIKEAYPLVLSL